jgi:SAM-dependent methyltransferase
VKEQAKAGVTVFSEEELLELWRKVVDPRGIGMPESIAAEISSYTHEPVDDVLRKMESGTEDFKQLWEATGIDPANPADIEQFYRRQFVEAYELANWHCGRTNGVPPLEYAWAAKFALARGLTRVLDFGSGIGTGSLCFASVGCEVDAADVACELLRFVNHRFRQRGYNVNAINLSDGEKPRGGYYDLIACFDVLEHIPDQVAKVRELWSYLRQGGYLLANFLTDSSDKDRPMHVSSAREPLRLIHRTPLAADWSVPQGRRSVYVLKRSRIGHLRNIVARYRDRLLDLRDGLQRCHLHL